MSSRSSPASRWPSARPLATTSRPRSTRAPPLHWRALPPLDHALALPAGCEPLSKHVRGPAALDRRLAQIGVVADHASGRALSARLAQGQRLVAKDGALWRWDGFTVAAGAATPAAKRLGQKKELETLRLQLAEAQAALETARARLIERQDGTRAALAAERRAREEAREAFAALNAAREAETRLAQRAQQQSARLATLAASAAQLSTRPRRGRGSGRRDRSSPRSPSRSRCRAPASRGLPRAARRDAPASARAAKCQRPPPRRGGARGASASRR